MKSAKRIFALLFCVTLLAGCSDNKKSVAELKDTNIRKVHAIYTFYMQNNGMKGPESEDVLMEYLDSPDGKFAIKRMNMDPEKLEDYFKSERDGEKFIIRYGLAGIKDHAIVFEATGGEEGKRFVALNEPIECDDEEYDEYLSGKVEGESGDGDLSGEDGEDE